MCEQALEECVCASLDVFEPAQTTWKLIKEHCPEGEIEEVKRILGFSLVEQTIDLHDEVTTLLEIWRQLREDTNGILACKENFMTSSQLPEPPFIRERLIKEIKFFINHLEKIHGGLCDSSEKHVHFIEYVNSTDMKNTGENRPQSTISSRDNRETPLRLSSSSLTDESQDSMLHDHLDGINSHINASELDKIVKNLRELLEQDCDRSRHDLQFLQECLEEEQNFVTSIDTGQQNPIPSLKELREFGSHLEKEYLGDAKYSFNKGDERGPGVCPLPPLVPKPSTKSANLNRASKVHLKSGRMASRIASSTLQNHIQ